MARVRKWLIQKYRSIASHTRVVVSGSYPLYRYICFAGLISSILTFVYGKWPASFVDATKDSILTNVTFNSMQLLGCGLSLSAFYLHRDREPSRQKVHLSLSMERIGIILMAPVVVVYTYGVIKQNGGPPTTWATLCLLAFGAYLVFRFTEIGKALKEVQKPYEQCVKERGDSEELRSE